jgi:hypothetical protein
LYVIRFCAAHGIVITGLGFRTPNEQLSHEVMTCTHTVFHKVSQTGDETRSQDSNIIHGKKKGGTKLVFLPKLVLKGVLDLP